MTTGFKAWKIPDDKRKEAIEIIDALMDAIGPRRAHDLGYDYYSDPIMKFQNFDILSEKNQQYMNFKMKYIGAKDVTEIYSEN